MDIQEQKRQRGLIIAATLKIEHNRLGWKVPSQSGNGSYVVNLDGNPFCTCPDFEKCQAPCKHIYAVEFTIQRETKPDGTVTETKTMRVAYTQDWTAYNSAQTHEEERFVLLLRALCDTVPQPPQAFGRPRLPMSDVIFGIAYKTYSTMSGRRFMTNLGEAKGKGLVDEAPSFTSTFRSLEDPSLTPILKELIELSARPLRSVETDFAVDSSGFATLVYARWFDHKYGKERSRQTWVKTHLMCGVKTHIVTAVEATPFESADVQQLPALLSETAKTFDITEVSAEEAYSDRRNLHAVEALGGTAYIPFRSNSTGMASLHHKFDGLWNYMWAYYNFNREKFLEHYHKRSNVETTFSMIKTKFGTAIRAKTPTAQVNEVLSKVLCHNICVLIQSFYELGIAADFTQQAVCSKSENDVPKLAWN